MTSPAPEITLTYAALIGAVLLVLLVVAAGIDHLRRRGPK